MERRVASTFVLLLALLGVEAPARAQVPPPEVCDPDGVAIEFTVGFFGAGSSGFRVTQVIVEGIDPACDGADVFVTLADDTQDLAAGVAHIDAPTEVVAMDAPPLARDVERILVEIAGGVVLEEVVAPPEVGAPGAGGVGRFPRTGLSLGVGVFAAALFLIFGRRLSSLGPRAPFAGRRRKWLG